MLPIRKKISLVNFTDKNDTNRIKYIVIHYFGSLGTAEAVANYFYSIYRKASAHYSVDETSIWQIVDDGDIAWHCGDNGAGKYKTLIKNSNSIGIEMRPLKMNKSSLAASDKDWYFTDKTIENTIDLVRYLMNKYNVPIQNVVRHYDVTAKWCPRPFMGDDINSFYKTTGNEQWQKFLAQIEGDDIVTQEQFEQMFNTYMSKLATKPPSSWSQLARTWAEQNQYIKGDSSGNKQYQKLITREETVQLLYNILK